LRRFGLEGKKTLENAMPQKRVTAAAVGKILEERRDAARDAALREIRALRTDLATVEAVLTGRRKKNDLSLFDVIHGAQEIFRQAAAVFDADALLAECAREIEEVKALEFLEKHGATELVKPSGWHWISPKGEMHCLGKADDPEGAAAKLTELLQGGRRSRRRDPAAASRTAEEPSAAEPASGGPDTEGTA